MQKMSQMVLLTDTKSVHRTVGVSPILGFAVKSLKQDCGVEI